MTFDATPTEYEGEAAWLEGRRSSIGASESAGILGYGYAEQSAMTIYSEKIGKPVPREVAERMRWGKLMETSLRAIFTASSGLECYSAGETTIWNSIERPWMSVTLDAFVEDRVHGKVHGEIKNVDVFQAEDWKDGGIPLKHEIQVQHGMYVLGTQVAHLFGFIGGNRAEHRLIHRDDRFIDAMLEALKAFWLGVCERTPPEPDNSAATAAALKVLHPDEDGTATVLPEEAQDWLASWLHCKEAIKELEAFKQEASNRLRMAIGDSSFGVVGDTNLSLHVTTRQSPPKEASTSTFRVLRIDNKALPDSTKMIMPPEPEATKQIEAQDVKD